MTTDHRVLTEATDPDVLAPQTEAALVAGVPWRRFAVFGDSLSLGVGDPAPGYDGLGWPDRVARALRRVHPDLAYLNTGRVGATTAQALAEQAARIDDFDPDLLHLNSGANDIICRTPDWDRIEDDLRAMYQWAHHTGAQLSVFTLGRAFNVPAFGEFSDRVARLNDLTRTLSAEYDAVLVECWDHPLNDRPDLLSADKIHFATTGQAIIASLMLQQLAARLGHLDAGPR